jgi:hypothetical protein
MRDALLGNICERSAVESLMAKGDVWGKLRFLADLPESPGVNVWSPDKAEQTPHDPNDWQAEYILLSPLLSPDGELLGTFSLDSPVGGRLPGPVQRELVEAYSDRVARAISAVRNP